ncbi:kinase-like domain-containing protein, partial [Kockovaella imperatae]
ELEARYIFRQIVDAVGYLHHRNIYHRDLKDENIVIDRNLQIKIVDFGSAVYEDRLCPPVLYDQFRGTIAYASAEVLSGQSYRAGPTDIWCLGILLGILFTGESPFPDPSYARRGKIKTRRQMPPGPYDLMKRCLVVKPEFRITIHGVREHEWI